MKVIDEKKIDIEFIKRAINVLRWRRMALSLVVLLKGEGYLDATRPLDYQPGIMVMQFLFYTQQLLSICLCDFV